MTQDEMKELLDLETLFGCKGEFTGDIKATWKQLKVNGGVIYEKEGTGCCFVPERETDELEELRKFCAILSAAHNMSAYINTTDSYRNGKAERSINVRVFVEDALLSFIKSDYKTTQEFIEKIERSVKESLK